MLYVKRDDSGAIIALTREPDNGHMEKVSLLDDEVTQFLQQSGEIDSMVNLLALSDNSMVRVIEDLIDLLISKNIILFTDLPEQAQKKIEARRKARRNLNNEDFMVDDIL
jgi:predicted nucleic acid-binding protein